MGEGWHNNHHAYPSSGRFGHKWWELDLGYTLIRLFALCGLCTDVKEPDYTTLQKSQTFHFELGEMKMTPIFHL